MQAHRPLLDEQPGHRGRVFAEDQLTAIVSLHEADAFSAAQVDGRPNLHENGDSPEAIAS